ncbi:rCG51437 [Rattus norvegicus]|uniref:RCG51437 n=1 Tax=Rattus norvegicus TaxID=10116 RepID=A6IZU0_RAT|nr:rCG51437 [Rattus norvegicus]
MVTKLSTSHTSSPLPPVSQQTWRTLTLGWEYDTWERASCFPAFWRTSLKSPTAIPATPASTRL